MSCGWRGCTPGRWWGWRCRPPGSRAGRNISHQCRRCWGWTNSPGHSPPPGTCSRLMRETLVFRKPNILSALRSKLMLPLLSSPNFPHITSLMFPLTVFALNKVLRAKMIFLIRRREVYVVTHPPTPPSLLVSHCLLSTLRPSDLWQKTSPSLTTHW